MARVAEKKSGPITIRLSPDVIAQLRVIADREDRSLSYVMDRELRARLEGLGELAPVKRRRVESE